VQQPVVDFVVNSSFFRYIKLLNDVKHPALLSCVKDVPCFVYWVKWVIIFQEVFSIIRFLIVLFIILCMFFKPYVEGLDRPSCLAYVPLAFLTCQLVHSTFFIHISFEALSL
jgi:hypothetical protein